MNRSPYQILQKPIVTEKSLAVKAGGRSLCFKVDPNATKTEIKEAVQIIFKVKVESVHTSTFAGKMRRRAKRLVTARNGRRLTSSSGRERKFRSTRTSPKQA